MQFPIARAGCHPGPGQAGQSTFGLRNRGSIPSVSCPRLTRLAILHRTRRAIRSLLIQAGIPVSVFTSRPPKSIVKWRLTGRVNTPLTPLPQELFTVEFPPRDDVEKGTLPVTAGRKASGPDPFRIAGLPMKAFRWLDLSKPLCRACCHRQAAPPWRPRRLPARR